MALLLVAQNRFPHRSRRSKTIYSLVSSVFGFPDFQVFCSMPPVAAIQWAIQLSDLLVNRFSGRPYDHMRLSWTVGHLADRLLRLKLKYPPDAETCTSVYPCLLPLWDTKPAHTRRPVLWLTSPQATSPAGSSKSRAIITTERQILPEQLKITLFKGSNNK